MKHNDPSSLGELQAEGNLGNERNRNTANEGTIRERSRESEDRESREDWSPSDVTGTHDTNDARRGGER